VRPTIGNQENSRKCPAAMDTVDLVEGFFELPSDQTELFLVFAVAAIYFLWWLLAPVIRSLFERISGGGTAF